MSTHAIGGLRGATGAPTAARRQVPWIAGGLALGFAVPFVLADRLELQQDLYYGLYGLIVLSFVYAWARATERPLAELVAHRWKTAVALGLLCGALLAVVVLSRDATTRPSALGLAGTVLWRGVFYGAIDGLLLSAFPILAVFGAFEDGDRLERRLGRVEVGALALVASLAMTAVYHLGYSDFRSAKVRSPLAGDVVWSAPTLLTLNPIGAPIAHATMHVTAVLHSYHTDLFLPPHR